MEGETADEEEKWAAHCNQLNIYRGTSFWHLDDEERQPKNYQMARARGWRGLNINWQIDPVFPRLIPLTLAGLREAPERASLRSSCSETVEFRSPLPTCPLATCHIHTTATALTSTTWFTQAQDGSLCISCKRREIWASLLKRLAGLVTIIALLN